MTTELAEVWCSECDGPATGPDAKCELHGASRIMLTATEVSCD